jgi:signal transduction histidine kinase
VGVRAAFSDRFGARAIRRLPIRRRLILGFSAILACMGGAVILAGVQLVRVREMVATIDAVQIQEKSMTGRVDRILVEMDAIALRLLTDPGDRAPLERTQSIGSDLVRELGGIQPQVRQLTALASSAVRPRLVEDLQKLELLSQRLVNALAALRQSRSVDSFLAFNTVADQIDHQMARLEDSLDAMVLQSTAELRRRLTVMIAVAWGLFGVALVLAILISLLIARSLVGPIRVLSHAARRMANGEWDVAVPVRLELNGRDELASLATAFNRMAEALRSQLAEVNRMNATLETRVSERTAELARRNEELDTFTSTVSHDLKSPVVALQGLATILAEDYGDRLDDQGQQYLRRLKRNVVHMGDLIQDLLMLSRVGRTEVCRERVAVKPLVEDVLALYADALTARGIRVEIADLPDLVADRIQLKQVFQNLVSNAIKFLGDQPAPCISIRCENLKGFVRFEVADNGIGIDPSYHDKIFVIFQRLQDVDVEGTGVGLAIVKKVVEQAGGALDVRSAKGAGAVFAFTWPIDDAALGVAA